MLEARRVAARLCGALRSQESRIVEIQRVESVASLIGIKVQLRQRANVIHAPRPSRPFGQRVAQHVCACRSRRHHLKQRLSKVI